MSKYFIFYALVVQYFLVSNCKQFGYLDLFTCHCKDDNYCNSTGNCQHGCATGWFGPTCQKQNVAFGKPAVQSKRLYQNYRGPELAVDGNRTLYYTKCMDTGYSDNRWWSVNLIDTYPIKQIHIFYRQNLYTLRGYKIDVIQPNGTQVGCYKQPVNVKPSSTEFTVSCNNVIWGNGINISSTSGQDHFFVFCEVEVYGLCSNRRYGENCEKFCYCKDNVSCDDVTGECPTEECLPGYTGSSCNRPCEYGKYGLTCSKDCNDRHCYGSQDCIFGTGRCTQGCLPGYNGTDCTQNCPETTYGLNCSNLCDNRKCSGSEECNHITGNCTEGCLPGYSGVECSQICDEGFYGVNCSKKCSDRYCINNSSICDNENGNCNGDCHKDYSGVDCMRLDSSSAPVDDPAGENDSTMIIGAVLGSIVIILLVVIIGAFVYFRKRRSSTSTTTPNTGSQKHRKKLDNTISNKPDNTISNEPDNTIRNEPTLPEDHAYINEIFDNYM